MEQSNENTESKKRPMSFSDIDKFSSNFIHTSAYQTGMTYLINTNYGTKGSKYHCLNNYVDDVYYCKIFNSKDEIDEMLIEIYDFVTIESSIPGMTDKIPPQIEEWKNRSLSEVYPVIYIDALHFSVRDNGIIKKIVSYVILGINCGGNIEVLNIEVGDIESAKYWLSVLNGLKNRGVKDILIICADDITGIREAIRSAFPKAEYQSCIVHQIQNTLKYVANKDHKAIAEDLETIYYAPNEEHGRACRDLVTKKWADKYPNAMKRWERDWDVITPIFKFSPPVRAIIYATNEIDSLNAIYRKLNRQDSIFPNDKVLVKFLYIAAFEATKRWTISIRYWDLIYRKLQIMYKDRLPD